MQTTIVAIVLAQLAAVHPAETGLRMNDGRPDGCTVADTAALQPHRKGADEIRSVAPMRECRPVVRQPELARVEQEGTTPRDEWFAVDKVQHFAMAYGTAMFGYGVLRGAGASHGDARAGAIAGSLAAGIGKELFDQARGGPFSLKDLTWDVLGTLAAWGLLSLNR